MCDLDFGGQKFVPIGTPNQPFTGTYYGNGYTIQNIKYGFLQSNNQYFHGFFAVAKNATIHGMSLENVIVGDDHFLSGMFASGLTYCGGIIAYSEETEILSCRVTGIDISYMQTSKRGQFCTTGVRWTSFSGGICGFGKISTYIDSCAVTDFTIDTYVQGTPELLHSRDALERNICGGIIGETYHDVTIKNCYVEGDFTVNNSWTVRDSKLFIGGVSGLTTNLNGYDARIEGCVTDIKVNHNNNNSTKFVSAITTFGSNTDSSMADEYSDNLYYVADDYEGYDNAIWDQEANAFDGNMIYTDLFLYDVIHFDPLLWDVEDGVFVLKVPQIV
jgi:hypothetical protein